MCTLPGGLLRKSSWLVRIAGRVSCWGLGRGRRPLGLGQQRVKWARVSVGREPAAGDRESLPAHLPLQALAPSE